MVKKHSLSKYRKKFKGAKKEQMLETQNMSLFESDIMNIFTDVYNGYTTFRKAALKMINIFSIEFPERNYKDEVRVLFHLTRLLRSFNQRTTIIHVTSQYCKSIVYSSKTMDNLSFLESFGGILEKLRIIAKRNEITDREEIIRNLEDNYNHDRLGYTKDLYVSKVTCDALIDDFKASVTCMQIKDYDDSYINLIKDPKVIETANKRTSTILVHKTLTI